MSKRAIDISEYANTITESLKKGVFLTTKAGDKINSRGRQGTVLRLPPFVVKKKSENQRNAGFQASFS